MKRRFQLTLIVLALLAALAPARAGAQPALYSITGDALVDEDGNPLTFLKRIDPVTGRTFASLPITMLNPPPPIAPGDHRNEFVVSGHGLATHPQTGALYTALSVQSDVETSVIRRYLAVIDPLTGETTLIRAIGRFDGLAFTTGGAFGPGVLLGVTGDGQANGAFCPPMPQCPGSTLFQLHDDGSVTRVKDFESIAPGEAITFSPVDLRVYHTSGGGQLRLFESLALAIPAGPTTKIPLNGAPSEELTGLTFAQTLQFGQSQFLAASVTGEFFSIASFGAVTKLGTLDHRSNGLAFVTPPAPTTLAAAVLPSSRAVRVSTPATAFVSIVNTGDNPAFNVSILLTGTVPPTPAPLPVGLTYNTTDCATNAVVGGTNAPTDIPPGERACFVISLTPSAAFEPFELGFTFGGVNTPPAVTLPGINTLLMSASATPVPDPVALAVTPSGDGILRVPGVGETSAFAVATANVGATGFITVFANTGPVALPVVLTVCQTVPATGVCTAPPAPSVIVFASAGATPTFAVFARATAPIPPNAATNRIYVLIHDDGAIPRGRTSVAVQTE